MDAAKAKWEAFLKTYDPSDKFEWKAARGIMEVLAPIYRLERRILEALAPFRK